MQCRYDFPADYLYGICPDGKDDKVEKVEVGANQYNITPKSDDKTLVKMTYYTGFIKDENLLNLLNKHKVEIDGYIPNNTSTWVFNILSIVLPLIIIWIIFGAVMKKPAAE